MQVNSPSFGVSGLVAETWAPNTPDTSVKVRMSATRADFRRITDGLIIPCADLDPVDVRIDAPASPPTASVGYRDTAAVFTPGSDVWFYFLLNSATGAYAGVSSARPPRLGPKIGALAEVSNLQPFDAYCHALPVRVKSTPDGCLWKPFRVRGNRLFYEDSTISLQPYIGAGAPPAPWGGWVSANLSKWLPAAAEITHIQSEFVIQNSSGVSCEAGIGIAIGPAANLVQYMQSATEGPEPGGATGFASNGCELSLPVSSDGTIWGQPNCSTGNAAGAMWWVGVMGYTFPTRF